jgi:hypothetical protein
LQLELLLHATEGGLIQQDDNGGRRQQWLSFLLCFSLLLVRYAKIMWDILYKWTDLSVALHQSFYLLLYLYVFHWDINERK